MSNSPKLCTFLHHENQWSDGDAWSKWFGLMPPKKASCSCGCSLQFCSVGTVGGPTSEDVRSMMSLLWSIQVSRQGSAKNAADLVRKRVISWNILEQAVAQSILLSTSFDHEHQHVLARLKYAEVKRSIHAYAAYICWTWSPSHWPAVAIVGLASGQPWSICVSRLTGNLYRSAGFVWRSSRLAFTPMSSAIQNSSGWRSISHKHRQEWNLAHCVSKSLPEIVVQLFSRHGPIKVYSFKGYRWLQFPCQGR